MVGRGQGQVQEEDWVSKVVWRIVGASESPLKAPKLAHLINNVVREYVPNDEQKRTIETINSWYETRDGRPVLTDESRDKVDELVLRGAAQWLLMENPDPNNDTLFWATGAMGTEAAAETILASWDPELIDKLFVYSKGVLRVLCERANVIDVSDAIGFRVEGGRAYVKSDYKQDRVRTLRQTDLGRPEMYRGVANVIGLLIMIRPDRFPELVEAADHPIVQRWALFIVSGHSTTDGFEALKWLSGRPSEPLIAIAVVHALENIRELGWRAEHPGRDQQEREESREVASRLLSGLVSQLAQYEPAQSVHWISELYEQGALLRGMNRRSVSHDLGGELEEQCIDKLAELARLKWDSDLRVAFESDTRWGAATRQNLPLGTVALKIHEDYPDRATEIARIALEKHARYIQDMMANNHRAYYTLTEGRALNWMRGLGAALSIALPEGDTPLDWAITQCSQLPLSLWDADDRPEVFQLADDVAQIQLTAALYGVIARYEGGQNVEPEMVGTLAEKAWEHCHFLRQQEPYRLEEPELDELAARVAIALGNASEEWLIIQAKSPLVGPRGLWAVVDAYIEKNGYPNLASELGSTIAARHRDIKGADISTLRYLAMIWQRLEASEAALETAETLMEFHRKAMERQDYIVVMDLLVLAARQGEQRQEQGDT